MNVLIGSVGYHNLRDLSFGPNLLARLAEFEWPGHVELEDVSYNPVAVVQTLEDTPGKYGRAIFISAVQRGRQPGMLELYTWQPPEMTIDLVQERVGEGVTGVISLDNLLIVCRHFAVLPPEVICVEIEPINLDFGDGYSQEVAARFEAAIELVRHEALSEITHARQGGICLRD